MVYCIGSNLPSTIHTWENNRNTHQRIILATYRRPGRLWMSYQKRPGNPALHSPYMVYTNRIVLNMTNG